eukprot:349681-Chlamydomonas_euryale.AAC.7
MYLIAATEPWLKRTQVVVSQAGFVAAAAMARAGANGSGACTRAHAPLLHQQSAKERHATSHPARSLRLPQAPLLRARRHHASEEADSGHAPASRLLHHVMTCGAAALPQPAGLSRLFTCPSPC